MTPDELTVSPTKCERTGPTRRLTIEATIQL